MDLVHIHDRVLRTIVLEDGDILIMEDDVPPLSRLGRNLRWMIRELFMRDDQFAQN